MAETAKPLPQPMCPSGKTGRVFGWLMARINEPAYRWTVAQLRAIKPQSILEIGFGTGHCLELAIRKLKLKRVAGRDPSDLMVETAQKRLKRFRKKVMLDIAKGDDITLPNGPFDGIIALHSFQFWADPAMTLAKLRALLTPNGRLILVLRRHYSGSVAKALPNPLSHSDDEVAATIAAAKAAGFALITQETVAKTSQGLVFVCG